MCNCSSDSICRLYLKLQSDFWVVKNIWVLSSEPNQNALGHSSNSNCHLIRASLLCATPDHHHQPVSSSDLVPARCVHVQIPLQSCPQMTSILCCDTMYRSKRVQALPLCNTLCEIPIAASISIVMDT